MAYKDERARQLYLQAKRAHIKGSPEWFNNEYTVPTELLYRELTSDVGLETNQDKTTYRSFFERTLRRMIEDGDEYDKTKFDRSLLKLKEELFTVYFGIQIKCDSTSIPLPFGKIFKSGGVTFRLMSYNRFCVEHERKCLEGYYQKVNESLLRAHNAEKILRDSYYLKSKVVAFDFESAANTVVDAFEPVFVSANLAQARGRYKYSLFNNRNKRRSVMSCPGIVLASMGDHSGCNILWSSSVAIGVDERLTFTSDKNRLKAYHMYRRIFRENFPISERIRRVMIEFSRALDADDPYIRQLGFWRCLEIATGRNDGSRKEKEIIRILGNYYPRSDSWKQQGGLIKDIRNSYVHSGEGVDFDSFGSIDRYLNWTQEYADKALGILLWMRSNGIGKERSLDIDDIFDFYSMSNDLLSMAGKLLKGRE